jgi:serine/threonine protein kinase
VIKELGVVNTKKPVAATVEDFGALLIRSRLYTVENVKTIYDRWQAVARNPAKVDDFASWLVGKQYITEYQAGLLQNGLVDNFFLNRYKILDRIGKGRMAGVYKAAGPEGQVVAIKVLPPSKAKDPEMAARFQRETRLALQLNHPNVVRTMDFGKSNGLNYLVMEFLEGVTLLALLNQHGKLSPKEVGRIALLATLGLQHIHEKGLVHRDVKPANLMLCPAPAPEENTLRSMVKILDIGLGRAQFDPKSRDAKDDLTNEGTLLGTPDYLAPEQARDARRADIRADLYSLGCTLYHALAGQPPFLDDNIVRQILRHATQQPRPLVQFNPDVPEGLAQVVGTMMAKDPAQRYQTPGEAAEALKGFLAGQT